MDHVLCLKIADVIDFEWFLAEDGDVDDAELRARDGQIFKSISPTMVSLTVESRREMFRAGLEARRSQARQTPPGEHFSRPGRP